MASYGTLPGYAEPQRPASPSPLEAIAPYVAEFMGTFMLVFTAGVCSVVGDAAWNATAIACMLMVMIYAFGPISGGHLNPSVSIACGLVKATPWPKVAGYCLAQVVGGCMAGWAYYSVFSTATPVAPKNGFTWFEVGVVEIIYTAMLCFVVLNCAVSVRNNPKDDGNCFFALAIGFTIVAGGYAAGNISGGLFNPAVTLGLDVMGGGHADNGYWRLYYVIYQLLGAGLAATLYLLCRGKELEAAGAGPTLQLRVLGGLNFGGRSGAAVMGAPTMPGETCDSFVTARVGLQEYHTPVCTNTQHPVWRTENSFFFNLIGRASKLGLEAFAEIPGVKDQQSLGTLSVDLNDVPLGEWQRRKWRLVQQPGRDAQLEFELRLDSTRYEPSLMSKVLSEFLGTFMLVLTVGLNLVMRSPATPWSAAAALMCMIYSLGNVSGGHFNPAVTLGVVLSGRGKCLPFEGLFYIWAQLVAGILAGLVYAEFHAVGPYRNDLFGLAPGVLPSDSSQSYSWSMCFAAETAFTFMLAFVVLAVATTAAPRALTKQNFQFALAIGSCVTAGGFAIGGVSGGELNPAVSFGIATGAYVSPGAVTPPPWHYCLYFSIFQLCGGVLAAVVFFFTHAAEYKR